MTHICLPPALPASPVFIQKGRSASRFRLQRPRGGNTQPSVLPWAASARLQPSGERAWLGLEISASPGPVERSPAFRPGAGSSASLGSLSLHTRCRRRSRTPTAPFCGPWGVLCSRRPLLPGTPPFSHSELGNEPGEDTVLDRRGDAGESGETEAQFSPGALVNARPHLGAPTCLPLPTLSPPDSGKIDSRSWNT